MSGGATFRGGRRRSGHRGGSRPGRGEELMLSSSCFFCSSGGASSSRRRWRRGQAEATVELHGGHGVFLSRFRGTFRLMPVIGCNRRTRTRISRNRLILSSRTARALGFENTPRAPAQVSEDAQGHSGTRPPPQRRQTNTRAVPEYVFWSVRQALPKLRRLQTSRGRARSEERGM